MCKQFVELCRELGLFAQAIVAIDGSKFKLVNSRDNCFTQSKIKFRMKLIEDSINQYLAALDLADKQEPSGSPDGMNLPDEIARREDRLTAIAVAKSKIEARAQERFCLRAESSQHEALGRIF